MLSGISGGIFSGLWNVVKVFFEMFQIPLFIFLSIIALFVILCIFNVLYLRYVKGVKKPKGERYRVPSQSILKRLFYLAPKQFAKDYMNKNPEFFRHQGMIIYTGRQGKGKTVALVEQTLRMQAEYPKAKVIGNLDYKFQDEELDHWSKLIDYKNGIQGVIAQIDETQNWFSSNQSKDFPPEMLEVITQNRKNRRIILGTAQSFNRLAKPIREQTTEVRECHTLAGCVTFVFKKEPVLNYEGEVEKLKNRGMYFFVHNDEIRNAYDTYRVIEKLRESGFKPQQPPSETKTVITFDKKTLKKLK